MLAVDLIIVALPTGAAATAGVLAAGLIAFKRVG